MKRSIVAAMLIALSTYTLADSEVWAIELESRLNESRMGDYNALAEKLIKDFKVTSFRRAQRDFVSGSGCIFPASIDAYKMIAESFPPGAPTEMIQSNPIDVVSIAIWGLESEPTTKSLKGKYVIITHGLNSDILLPFEPSEIASVHTQETLIANLMTGKADYIVAISPDIEIAASNLKIKNLFFSNAKKGETLLETQSRLVCKKNRLNEERINYFNENLKVLKDTGELKNILSEYAKEY